MKKFELKLYVIGQHSRSRIAVDQAKKLLAKLKKNSYDFEIIDILKNPEKAEEDKILAVPTLVKSFPLPVSKVIGDFQNYQRIIDEFCLIEK